MSFCQQFARDPELCFLNAGSLSKTPLVVLEEAQRLRMEQQKNPTRVFLDVYSRLWAAQKDLAAFFHASPHDLFLRPNITHALSDLLFAADLPKGKEVLVSELEYGGTVELIKYRCARDGIVCRTFPLPMQANAREEDFITAILASLNEKTGILVLSHITTGTGTILPITRIAAETRKRGILLFVDGAHAPGALKLDFSLLDDVDFYAGNLHKWFMGMWGTAIGWVNPRHAKSLRWTFGGWASEQPLAMFHSFGEGNPETARRFLQGTVDTVPFLLIPTVIQFWKGAGEERMQEEQARLRDLCAKLVEEQLGFERLSGRESKTLGPLIAYRLPELWRQENPAVLAQTIFQNKVQLALPKVKDEIVIRFSPGVYTTEEEIHTAVRRLKNMLS